MQLCSGATFLRNINISVETGKFCVAMPALKIPWLAENWSLIIFGFIVNNYYELITKIDNWQIL